ncbi:MAG: trypsin-like peptidase domain-containing protein [Deltaproteobacteria bacterium]|jgi:S1-C subfamily serine protease|nr:trypsin-like peptidase domain-containing protein [Deltaproteobacteria bacterium]
MTKKLVLNALKSKLSTFKYCCGNIFPNKKLDGHATLPDLFGQYKKTIVPINVEKPNGDLDCGTGFHIGDGYIVTARHVVEGMKKVEIEKKEIQVGDILYHKDVKVDLAVIRSNFNLNHWMEKTKVRGRERQKKIDRIQLGGHLDDWIGDEFILSSALIVGYPQIPRSKFQVPIAAYAQVGAVMDEYSSPHPYFILNTTARGGYSGGPVISEGGFLLGVVTDCFYHHGKPYETGFMAAITVEPLLLMLQDHGIKIKGNENILDEL